MLIILGGPARWELARRLPTSQRETLRAAAFVIAVILVVVRVAAGLVPEIRLVTLVDAIVVVGAIGVLVVIGIEHAVPSLPPAHPLG